MRRRRPAVMVVMAAVLAALFVRPPLAAGAVGEGGRYHPVTPTRILDTRTAAGGGALASAATRQVAIPSSVVPSGATSVVLTATATASTAGGYLTLYPAGNSRPATSNLNFGAGRTVPNLAVVGLTAGKIKVYNGSAGRTHVLLDVAGYVMGSDAPSGQGAFGTLSTPRRVLDTRSGAPVAGAASMTFTVTGVPADAAAVVLNLTATGETSSGWATAYAAGSARPNASNVNYARATSVANLAVVPLGSGGKVTLYNGSSGSAHFLADVSGYVLDGDPLDRGALGALRPTRVLDTRSGTGAAPAPVGAGKSLTLTVGGKAGVPLAAASAVVLNVTATSGTRSGFLAVYGSGTRPNVSQVNYAAGQTVADLVIAPVSAGKVTIYNGSSGSVQVIADVAGYVSGRTLTVPVTSTSRYVRNISDGGDIDVQIMHDEGCADATAGSTLVLLDIGAQLNDKTGVALTVIDRRVTYGALVASLNGYLAGFAACDTDNTAVIALGTNNGGDFTAYTAAARGAHWATKVVDAVTVPVGVAVVGANDIESGFASTERQAEDWETAYLKATSKPLYFNGSADGCPATYGTTGTCNFGWTQAQHYKLAGGLNPTRIKALPQIYLPAQAVQWANIQRVGGGAIEFVGALTEHAACGDPCSMTPSLGWAALYHSLSTLVSTPTIRAVTDLRIDG